jgi:cytochrome P450
MTETSAPTPASTDIFARLGPDFLANPYPFYEGLRSADPALWMPDLFDVGGWIVTGHAACTAVLRSKHFGKEGKGVVAPEKLAKIPQESADVAERRRHSMLFQDPPDHTRLRALVSQAFTPRTVERLRPHVAAIAEGLIDGFASAGRADLIRELAFPLPIIVIAELLGVPPEDRDQFKAWSTVMTQSISPAVTREQLADVWQAVDALNAYLAHVIEDRRRAPRADLISDLVRAQDAGDRLSIDELLATCRLILAAGHETTVNLIGNGMLALLRDPGQREIVAGNDALLPGAVEELLRYDSPVQMTARFAFEDTPIGAHTAKRGDMVLVLLGAANRDPAEYDEPGRLDVRRANAHTHLSLGNGIHYCLGAPLARLEGEIAVGALLRRLPGLSLGAEAPVFRAHPVLRGLQALPVTF